MNRPVALSLGSLDLSVTAAHHLAEGYIRDRPVRLRPKYRVHAPALSASGEDATMLSPDTLAAQPRRIAAAVLATLCSTMERDRE